MQSEISSEPGAFGDVKRDMAPETGASNDAFEVDIPKPNASTKDIRVSAENALAQTALVQQVSAHNIDSSDMSIRMSRQDGEIQDVQTGSLGQTAAQPRTLDKGTSGTDQCGDLAASGGEMNERSTPGDATTAPQNLKTNERGMGLQLTRVGAKTEASPVLTVANGQSASESNESFRSARNNAQELQNQHGTLDDARLTSKQADDVITASETNRPSSELSASLKQAETAQDVASAAAASDNHPSTGRREGQSSHLVRSNGFSSSAPVGDDASASGPTDYGQLSVEKDRAAQQALHFDPDGTAYSGRITTFSATTIPASGTPGVQSPDRSGPVWNIGPAYSGSGQPAHVNSTTPRAANTPYAPQRPAALEPARSDSGSRVPQGRPYEGSKIIWGREPGTHSCGDSAQTSSLKTQGPEPACIAQQGVEHVRTAPRTPDFEGLRIEEHVQQNFEKEVNLLGSGEDQDGQMPATGVETEIRTDQPATQSYEPTVLRTKAGILDIEPVPPNIGTDRVAPISTHELPRTGPRKKLEAQIAPPAPPLSDDEVLQHTAGLWKYLPVPSDEPDPAPEYSHDRVEYPGGTVIAARVRGKKHKHEGSNCDDWYEIGNYKDVTFLAVSDGAGSKKYSRVGAKASCEAAVAYLKTAFARMSPDVRICLRQKSKDDPDVQNAYGRIAQAVQGAAQNAYEAVQMEYLRRADKPKYAEALNRDLDIKDFSGTLLIAVVVPVHVQRKEKLLVSYQVGDGLIAVANTSIASNDAARILLDPDGGDFAGETEFLTSPKLREAAEMQKRTSLHRSEFDTVMVMSDGVADDYDPKHDGIRRLYCDLVVNGILSSQRGLGALPPAPQRAALVRDKLPAPLEFAWVNDRSVKVPLHYTSRICEAIPDLTIDELWSNSSLLDICSSKYPNEAWEAMSADRRLLSWLDNYTQRGSFDDRTLVIATIDPNTEQQEP